jgi:hypothetical protein
MLRISILVLTLASACRGSHSAGGTSETRPADPVPTGPTCAGVMPKMTQATVHAIQSGGADDAQVQAHRADAEALEPRLVELCVADAWSPALLACMDTTPATELDACFEHVTPEQEANVIELRDEQAATRAP